MMTEVVKGQSVDAADAAVQRFTERMTDRKPAPEDLSDELDALQGVKKYPARVKCALLPWTTLRESLALYRHREPVAVAGEEAFDCADAP
jgi:nitrogen fixation NifU-like protein